MQFLAQLVANPVVIGLVVLALIVWAWLSAVQFRSGTDEMARALTRARQRIEEAQDPLGFAAVYERVSADLATAPLLGPRWREYRETLLVPTQPNAPVRATNRAELWFDSGALLRAAGVATRYHAALPNLLVGAGLGFTFFGLMVALGEAGGIVAQGADQQARNDSLRKLLDAASFKFITSLAGLSLSIAYAALRNRWLRQTDAALDGFLSALEARVPLITPVALQAEANRLLEKQQADLQQFSNDLAVSMGDNLNKKFDESLSKNIGPLTEAMKQLAASISSGNEAAIRTMLNDFLTGLQAGTGDRMEEVAKTLGGMADRLTQLQSGLRDAATALSTGTEAAAGAFQAAAAEAHISLAGTASTMQSLVSKLETAANTLASTLANAASELNTAGTSAKDALQPLREVAPGLHRAVDQVAVVATQLAETQAAGEELSKELAQAGARFEGVDRDLARTLDELQNGLKGFTTLVASFVTQTDSNLAQAANHLSSLVKELDETLEEFVEQSNGR
jgi:ABC-type transporter Mla subunit MlaD